MRLASMFGSGFGSTSLIAVFLGLSAASLAAARGLNGSFRAFFMKTFVEGCMKIGAADPDVGKLPRAALLSLCRCSATYIAARATPAQLDRPDSPETLAIQAEATRTCLHR